MDREDGRAATTRGERDEDARNERRENEGREKQLDQHLLIFQKVFFHPITVGLECATLGLGSSLCQSCNSIQLA